MTTQAARHRADLPTGTTAIKRHPEAAGVAYVLVWLVGLVVAPAAPELSAGDREVHAFFADHAGAAVLQSVLVHGVAAAALAVVVLACSGSLPGRSGRFSWVCGLAAVGVSISQLAVTVSIAVVVGDSAAGTTAGLLDVVNYLDSVKLLLLGAWVAAVTVGGRASAGLPPWLAWVGAALAPLLPISGAAFVLGSGTLYLALYLSLPLLLLWVCAVSIVLPRSPRG